MLTWFEVKKERIRIADLRNSLSTIYSSIEYTSKSGVHENVENVIIFILHPGYFVFDEEADLPKR